MTSILRALGCALLVGLLLPQNAAACTRPSEIAEPDDFQEARYVFHALLVKAELSDIGALSLGDTTSRTEFSKIGTVVGTYELKNAVKGNPPQRGQIVSTTGIIGGCALPLLAGQEYIFFVPPWPADAPAELSKTYLGMVSIFGSFGLTGYEPTTQEDLARLRGYVAK